MERRVGDACPVCGGVDVEVRGIYRGTHAAFAGLRRAHCACGMVFAAPMPSHDALEEYNRSYFASAHGGAPRDPVAVAFFSAIARLRLAYVERYLAERRISVARVLELGPGPGFFGRSWLQQHPASVYMAAETDVSCHAALREASIHLIDPHAQQDDPVDLVVMSHVLEHVSNPREFLADATRNLSDGGAVFIEVPCRDWEHKSIDEPHLLFFDKAPMHRLLSTSGFENIRIDYFGPEIERLRSFGTLRGAWGALRSKLISSGLVAPFSAVRPGMETLADPLERAAVAPFQAHRESLKPAWWLRAMVQKRMR
jgi:SAM-dependent methyltransferase